MKRMRGYYGAGYHSNRKICTECEQHFYPGGWTEAAAAVTCSPECSRKRKTRLQKERRAALKQTAAGAGSLPHNGGAL